MAANESRPSRGFWATLNKVAESPRRADDEMFSRVGEIAAVALVFHDLHTLVSLQAKLEKIKNSPAGISLALQDRVYGMYLTVKRGATEVRNGHHGFNPVQEGINAGNERVRANTCRRERDIFDSTVDSILTTGRVKGFEKLSNLAAHAMATTNPESLKVASNYLTWLAQDANNPRIQQRAKGVLDIATPSLRIMNGALGQAETVCRNYEKRNQRRGRKPSS